MKKLRVSKCSLGVGYRRESYNPVINKGTCEKIVSRIEEVGISPGWEV